ncbi:cytochrome bc complex cytochrome b subunit [candidate division KSB1 bacterium]|nr:cytochrome bc complex cytochrome b subunit [candidate division KSB1 bacterium]NIR72296.1 cytochrome bc complex cytochrome b subunit [candidate division KSB1 bacterium]NIS26688.1 cytochrome bc complex cytochrome b subunit [candidate division KSB1 bacterium]NIT70324.1 cytochrome bc complex cytochrome b subunit [candidate division KSB1 bacterium]NIU27303.1 cytochrome bc complex cytochrome b subunit [candidate division KSB1 bacterium]
MQKTETFKQWFAESFPFDLNLLKEISSEPIPNHLKRWWFAIGGTPLYLFVIQATTGIILTFYYVPNPAEAFESVAHITTSVRFGWFIRSVHKWSAHLMVLTVMLHMLRVFFTSAYRRPRELNWMIGVGLLLTTVGFGFTGYSLIYEQISYWAAVVGTNIAEATPLIGGLIARFIRGGPEVSDNTLTRFFVFHIGVLPTVMVILLALHVVQIRLHGVTRLRFEEDETESVQVSMRVSAPVSPLRFHGSESESATEEEKTEERSYPFFPDHFYTEVIVGLTLTFILTILALVFPAHMGEPANPLVTPEHIKPEWYFFAVFRWLKLTSFQIGVVGSMIFLLFLLFWPFIDRVFLKKFPGKDVSFWIGVVGFFVFLVFTVWEAMV